MVNRWKFYGRQTKLQTLERFIQGHDGFSVMAIYGRRNVGKTELLHHFAYKADRQSNNARKIIRCSLSMSYDHIGMGAVHWSYRAGECPIKKKSYPSFTQ